MRLRAFVLVLASLLGVAAAVAAPAQAAGAPTVQAFGIPSAGPGSLMSFGVSGMPPGASVTPRLVDSTDPAVAFSAAPLTVSSGGGLVAPVGYRAPADLTPGTYRLEVDASPGSPVVSPGTATIVAPALTSLTDAAPGADAVFDMVGLGGDPAIARSVTVDGTPVAADVTEYLDPIVPPRGHTRLTVTMPRALTTGPHTLGFTQATSPSASLSVPFTAPPPLVFVDGNLAGDAVDLGTHDTIRVDARGFGPQGASLAVRDATGRTVALPRIDATGHAAAVLPDLAPGTAVFTAVGTANGAVASCTSTVLPSTLRVGSPLGQGGVLVSPTARTTLLMDWSGAVVVTHDSTRTWSSGVDGYLGYGPRLVVQSDGNMVVYGSDNIAIWSSRTSSRDAPPVLAVLDDGRAVLTSAHGTVLWASPTPATSVLASGATLRTGASLRAGAYLFAMQTDGNAVLYRGSTVLFRTATGGNPGSTLTLQGDGNLVLRNPAGRALWANYAPGGPGASLTMQTDGNLVERAASGHAVWTTGTAGR